MSWSTIDKTEVLEEFTPAEQATLQTIQAQIVAGPGGMAQTSTTNLENILARVVNAARGSISAGGNQLGQAGTIPDQVRNDVISISRWRWLVSFPQAKALQTDARKQAHDDAMKRLDAIAEGKPRVEVPEDPIATVENPITLPSFGTRTRKFTEETQDGI